MTKAIAQILSCFELIVIEGRISFRIRLNLRNVTAYIVSRI